MGRVVLAFDTKLHARVAVKLVPDELVADTAAIDDLRKEVLRGMALMHPGIVRTHQFELDESGAGIVMEYIDGSTLSELRAGQPDGCFDPIQILPWIERLCAVLDYAHGDARIAHRDLKPRNIMVTSDGRLKVADFGIAATLSDSISCATGQGPRSGTERYMSPQQARGKKPSPLDDIYALGATIYDLLTSKPPFFRGNILVQVFEVAPPPMSERRAEFGIVDRVPIPPAWEATIAACLAKDPPDRPRSGSEIIALLLADGPPSAAVEIPRIPDHQEQPEIDASGQSATHPPAPAPDEPTTPPPVYADATVRPKPRRHWRRKVAVGAAVGLLVLVVGQSGVIAKFRSPRPHGVVVVPTPKPVTPPPAALTPEMRFAEVMEQGRQLRSRGDMATSLTRFREASAFREQDPAPIAEIALTFERMNLFEKAAEQWKRIFEMGEAAGVYFAAAEAKMKLAQAKADETTQPVPPAPPEPVPAPVVDPQPPLPVAPATVVASKAAPWENSLGMRFVPVPIKGGPSGGQDVYFCIWETRVGDYARFVEQSGYDYAKGERMISNPGKKWGAYGATWKEPGFIQSPAHPVGGVSWTDAQQFCQWLTTRERAEGKIPEGYQYRLPSDHEWSCAAGVGQSENAEHSPKSKDGKVTTHFPWGNHWPPTKGAGNYADTSAKKAHPAWPLMPGYNDGFPDTAPVGSFGANPLGIYDLGGNLWEWCEDRYEANQPNRVLRGASYNDQGRNFLVTSYRGGSNDPDVRHGANGFRVVLAKTNPPTP